MRDTCAQAVAFAFVSHMTMTANNTAAHLRYQALERRLERLEERGRTARQRARRTGAPVGANSSGEGSPARPIIIITGGKYTPIQWINCDFIVVS